FEPADRPAEAGAVAAAVAGLRAAADERAHQAELAEAETKAKAIGGAKRRRLTMALAATVMLALLAGMIGTSLGLVQANLAAEAERVAKNDALEQKGLADQAAEQERQAKMREEERANGERQAKVEAEAKRKEAERNLAFAKKGNEILGS